MDRIKEHESISNQEIFIYIYEKFFFIFKEHFSSLEITGERFVKDRSSDQNSKDLRN